MALTLSRHDQAWVSAIEATPPGWFGPRVEPRFPNRWRAWIERPNLNSEVTPRESISVFGPTEEAALEDLTSRLRHDRLSDHHAMFLGSDGWHDPLDDGRRERVAIREPAIQVDDDEDGA